MENDDRPRDDDRLDLSALDPRADSARFEHLMRRLRGAAAPELLRRRGAPGLWSQLAAWRRPVLAASGVLALASLLILLTTQPAETRANPGTAGSSASTTAGVPAVAALARATGIPSEWADWIRSGRNPTPADLLGLEGSEQ